MKRVGMFFITVLIISVALVTTAFGADFEYCADELSEIGVFKGTDKGYELEREPTRLEAGVVLVNLLGGEEDALSLSYSAPFTDVPDWGKPYVQYLYDNGLTKGISETEFGATDLCTKEQYLTFLLRVLGYTEGEDGDFEYGDDARWFAEDIKLLDSANYPWDGFYRDNMAAITYTALALPVKPLTATSDEVILLEKLVNEGKIKGAEKLLEKFEEHRMVQTALKEFAEADRLSMDINFVIKTEYEDVNASIEYEMNYVCENNREDVEKSRMSMEAKMKAEVLPSNVEMPVETVTKVYYKDGYMYTNTDGKKEKIKTSFGDMSEGGITFDAEDANIPVCDFADAKKETKAGKIVIYEIPISGANGTITLKDGKLISIEGNDVYGMDVKIGNIKTDGTVIVRYPADLHMYEDVTSDPAGWGDLEKVYRNGELVIGMTMFEPLNYLDEETEELTGFETDFAREVCKRLGAEPVFVEIGWSDKEYSLEAGEIDCIWNGLTITDERKENMDFSEPYMVNFLSVFVRKADVEKYSKSAKDAIILDSEWRFFAGDMDYEYFKGNAKTTGGESYYDDLTALKSGKADMVVANAMNVLYLLSDEEFSDITILSGHMYDGETYGIAFRKESDLLPEINKIIKEMQEDGTLREIAIKYNLDIVLA